MFGVGVTAIIQASGRFAKKRDVDRRLREK
jgi:hypothetical protein